MNFATIGLGVLCAGYGVFSGFMRVKNPGMFRKLEPMKKFWGEKKGSAIHFVGYVVVPFCLGLFFIVSGIAGRSIF